MNSSLEFLRHGFLNSKNGKRASVSIRVGWVITPSNSIGIHFDSIEFGDFEGMPKWEQECKFLNRISRCDHFPWSPSRATLNSQVSSSSTTFWNLLPPSMTESQHFASVKSSDGWQMAYVLCTFFGEQGVREAMWKLLERNSMGNPIRGEEDRGRILGSFNEPIDHWLDFFCFTHFIDRDGKFQLKMLSTSSFKPLAASMGPMLKEESFHLGTGANGLRRVVKQGVIPMAFLQKYINKWVSTGLVVRNR